MARPTLNHAPIRPALIRPAEPAGTRPALRQAANDAQADALDRALAEPDKPPVSGATEDERPPVPVRFKPFYSPEQFVRVPHGQVRVTYTGHYAPLALKLVYAILNQTQIEGNLGALIEFDKAELAHALCGTQRALDRRDYRDLDEALKKLRTTFVNFEFVNPEDNRLLREGTGPLLEWIGKNHETGLQEIMLSRPYVAYLKLARTQEKGFAALRIRDVLNLHTTPEINLYEVMADVSGLENAWLRLVPYPVLRKKLGLTGAYYRDPRKIRYELKRRCETVNSLTDNHFEIERADAKGIKFRYIKDWGKTEKAKRKAAARKRRK
jgi:hypothetical protein